LTSNCFQKTKKSFKTLTIGGKMSPTVLEKNMEAIGSGRTSECLGCLARDIAIAYIIICDSDFREGYARIIRA